MVDLKLSLPDVAGTRRGQLTLKVGGETDSEDILDLLQPMPAAYHQDCRRKI